jgi:hypothetical protein
LTVSARLRSGGTKSDGRDHDGADQTPTSASTAKESQPDIYLAATAGFAALIITRLLRAIGEGLFGN